MKKQPLTFLIIFLIGITILNNSAFCLEKPGEELKEVGLGTELGAQIDSSLEFTDSEGRLVTLKSLQIDDRPTIIVPAYYDCPMLCGLLLNGFVKLISKIDLVLGEDYQVVTVSFDHNETSQLAAQKKAIFTEKFTGKGNPISGWHFLVGTEQNVKILMDQIGFYFKEDKEEFAHTAVIMILTSSFEISQYFTGIHFPVWDVRLSLVDAAEGSIGTAVDHVLLYCFRFDPTKGKYTWVATSVMRIGGAVTLLLLLALFFVLRKAEKKPRHER